jgi:gluconate 2-dehydrogenase alpha chain
MATVDKPADVVIVGFGWTGAIMAIELAQAGLNVLALERGDDAATVPNWAYPKVVDEIAQSARNGLLQNLSKTTVTIRHSKNDRAAPYRQIGSFKPGTGVGGAGIHWSGVHSRVMPDELRLRSRVIERYGAGFIPDDMSLQDWGITYDELEPISTASNMSAAHPGRPGTYRVAKSRAAIPSRRLVHASFRCRR